MVDRFLRPFLSGVLGEAELSTSAAFVRLVWRSFALGTIAVPGRRDGRRCRPSWRPGCRPACCGWAGG